MRATLTRFGYFPQKGRDFCEKPPSRHRFYGASRRKIEYLHLVNNETVRPTELEKQFNALAARWKRATSFHSSPTIKYTHEDYQAIIGLGEQVIPLLLSDLRKCPDWMGALKFFARKDAAKGSENMNDAVRLWLAWGLKRGFIK